MSVRVLVIQCRLHLQRTHIIWIANKSMTTNLLFFILIGMMLYDPKVERGENSHCLFMAAEADKRIWIEMSDITKVHLSNKTVPPRINGSKQLIPYYIHQTNEFDTLPSDMVMAIDSVIEHNPEYEYRFYNGTQRREFIAKNMGKTILQCYDRLVPNAFKADLFRYSVVYTLGGCYMDVGFVFVDHLRNTIRPDDTFLSTQDGFPPLTEANPAFFCATKNNPIIKEALRVVVKKVANSKYGIDPLDITGPRTFGRAFKYYFKNVSMLISPREYG